MIVVNLKDSRPFPTKDGSEIRSLLDRSNTPVRNQGLAQATLPPGAATREHRLVNTGREPVVFLCCCSPPYSHDDTVMTEE